MPTSGWVAESSLPTYLAGSNTNTRTFTATTDATTRMSVGWKVRYTDSTVKYGIITALTATVITVYMGTDYVYSSTSNPTTFDVSPMKSPLGFPMSPAKWTETFTDSTARAGTGTLTNWQNVGSIQLTVPIGVWKLGYAVMGVASATAQASGVTANSGMYITLSDTSGTSESSSAYTTEFNAATIVTINTVLHAAVSHSVCDLSPITTTVTTSTIYYLNMKASAGSVAAMSMRGDIRITRIVAECAYL
jgi:hypothetical protein